MTCRRKSRPVTRCAVFAACYVYNSNTHTHTHGSTTKVLSGNAACFKRTALKSIRFVSPLKGPDPIAFCCDYLWKIKFFNPFCTHVRSKTTLFELQLQLKSLKVRIFLRVFIFFNEFDLYEVFLRVKNWVILRFTFIAFISSLTVLKFSRSVISLDFLDA